MTFTRVWNETIPLGSGIGGLTVDNIDLEFRNEKTDLRERMDILLGAGVWAGSMSGVTMTIPQIIAVLTSSVTINPTLNYIPRKSGAAIYADSALSDDGTSVFLASARTKLDLSGTPNFHAPNQLKASASRTGLNAIAAGAAVSYNSGTAGWWNVGGNQTVLIVPAGADGLYSINFAMGSSAAVNLKYRFFVVVNGVPIGDPSGTATNLAFLGTGNAEAVSFSYVQHLAVGDSVGVVHAGSSPGSFNATYRELAIYKLQ